MSYSTTIKGKTGTDGVHRDINGDVIASGLDEDTKAEYQRQLDGPRVRLLPSENDILNGNVSDFGVGNPVYVDPNESDEARKAAYKPGYSVTGSSEETVPSETPAAADKKTAKKTAE